MKKERNFLSECREYSDLSSDNDSQARLIVSLLLNINGELEITELKILGKMLDDYINNKILLDHYFWKRSLSLCKYNSVEIASEI